MFAVVVFSFSGYFIFADSCSNKRFAQVAVRTGEMLLFNGKENLCLCKSHKDASCFQIEPWLLESFDKSTTIRDHRQKHK